VASAPTAVATAGAVSSGKTSPLATQATVTSLTTAEAAEATLVEGNMLVTRSAETKNKSFYCQ
jgi:tetrahydromethanopterin S-methyltransferase subunit D